MSNPQHLVEVHAELLRQIYAYREYYADIFVEYFKLLDQEKIARKHAEDAVRASGRSYGDWQVHNTTTKVDAQALLDLVGANVFVALGGTIEQKPVIKSKQIDMEKLKERLSEDMLSEIIKTTVQYKKPEEP